MPSRSGKTIIQDRFMQIFTTSTLANLPSFTEIFDLLKTFIEKEYQSIPEKERIGKGSVYLAKTIGRIFFERFSSNIQFIQDPWKFCNDIIQKGVKENDRNLYNLGLVIFSHLMSDTISNFKIGIKKLPDYASHPNWEIREVAIYAIRESLKKFPNETINALNTYIQSDDENLRRLVSESLRPSVGISWLRNKDRNDVILELLNPLKSDPSEYVRKSLGNNLKDLTKYMPEKILNLLCIWSKEYKITVTDDLASKSKRDLGDEEYNFIWMMKHALRWLKEKNLKFHPQIEKLLGKNYVQYFDEKKNRLAKFYD